MVNFSDLYVLAGLLAHDDDPWTFRELAGRLGVPVPLVQRGLKRAAEAGLYDEGWKSVHRANLEEFLLHAIRFVAPAQLEGLVPGVPCAWAARPLAGRIKEPEGEPPPVWPSARGRVRGQALQPLHKAAVQAADGDPRLAAWLAVFDSLRAGDVRVRSVAAEFAQGWLREGVTR